MAKKKQFQNSSCFNFRAKEIICYLFSVKDQQFKPRISGHFWHKLCPLWYVKLDLSALQSLFHFCILNFLGLQITSQVLLKWVGEPDYRLWHWSLAELIVDPKRCYWVKIEKSVLMLSDWDTEWKYSDFALLAEMKVLSNRGILKQMIMKQMQHLKQTLNSKSRFELFLCKTFRCNIWNSC